MRRLQYLRRCEKLSIENDTAPHVVGPHLRILPYHGQPGSYVPGTNFQRREPEVGFGEIAIDFLEARLDSFPPGRCTSKGDKLSGATS
jgi:hypothetical protein